MAFNCLYMNVLTTRPFIILILKYALALGVGVFLFSIISRYMYVAFDSWGTYAGIVALMFLIGGAWLGRRHTLDEKSARETAPCTPLYEILSRREMEVLELLLQNKTNQQIADHLCIELSTLKTHINKIYKKLDVKNRRELAGKMGELKVEG